MKTEYKHIRFIETAKLEEGYPVWLCENKNGEELAELTYYPKWKTYVDERGPSVVFDSKCNKDMGHFLEQLDKLSQDPAPMKQGASRK